MVFSGIDHQVGSNYLEVRSKLVSKGSCQAQNQVRNITKNDLIVVQVAVIVTLLSISILIFNILKVFLSFASLELRLAESFLVQKADDVLNNFLD